MIVRAVIVNRPARGVIETGCGMTAITGVSAAGVRGDVLPAAVTGALTAVVSKKTDESRQVLDRMRAPLRDSTTL
jgi:hypothetical protein